MIYVIEAEPIPWMRAGINKQNKFYDRQLHNLNSIEIAGGLALIIDENNVHHLQLLMDGFIK